MNDLEEQMETSDVGHTTDNDDGTDLLYPLLAEPEEDRMENKMPREHHRRRATTANADKSRTVYP